MLDKIRQIKYNRMKPEEKWVHNILTDLEEYYHPAYPRNKYYKHKDILLFNHNIDSGNFWCHYSNFWSVLERKFNLSTGQIRYLLKKMVEEYVIKNEFFTISTDTISEDELERNNDFIKKELIISDVTHFRHEKELIEKELIPQEDRQGVLLTVESNLLKK